MTIFLDLPKVNTFNTLHTIEWTAEKIERLKTLLIAGNSASRIGKALGVSKNSIIGKINRHKLMYLRPPKLLSERKHAVVRRTKGLAKRQLLKRGSGYFACVEEVKMKKEIKEEILTVVPNPEFACTFAELTENNCHYPIGDPQAPEFRFCGMPSLKGKPYCGHCSRLAYMPMTSMNLFGVPSK